VTLSGPAIVWITVDDRIPAEWNAGGKIQSPQDAADYVTSKIGIAGTFEDTGIDLLVVGDSDRPMSVYAAELPTGTYVFGSMDSGKNFYSIGAVPLDYEPPAPLKNLLANGGFEDGVTAPWSTYGDASMEVVQGDAASGLYSLKVTVNSAGANFWDAGLQHTGHVFEAGKSYTLSAYLKAQDGPMDINFKPERAADPWEGYGDQVFTMTTEWAEYSVNTGVIPADVDPASITFHIAFAPGVFFIDDVRFTED